MRNKVKRNSVTLIALCAMIACSRYARDDATTSSGTVVIASTGDADILFPPLVTSTIGREVTELVYDYLADVGPSMNTLGDADFRPALAKTWTWSTDSLSIAFHLDPRAR